MFCSECGHESQGGKFCVNCGTKLLEISTPESPQESKTTSGSTASSLTSLLQMLDTNWGSDVTLPVDSLNKLSIEDWGSLQKYLVEKSGQFIGLRTWAEYSKAIAKSDEVSKSFLDTSESVLASIDSFLAQKDPAKDSAIMMAAVGTRSSVNLGAPNSGQSHFSEVVELIEFELDFLRKTLRIGRTDNLIGESFDGHIKAIDLLSDFGRSFLVDYLGDTPSERKLLESWGPKVGQIAFDMTATLVVARASELLEKKVVAPINPHMVHLLIDSDNSTQPWWMEMGLWASMAESFKEILLIDIEDMDAEYLLACFKASLDPQLNTDPNSLQHFQQDMEMYLPLIEFIEPWATP